MFKLGDKVRCINPDGKGNHLQMGRVYTIINIYGDGEFLRVDKEIEPHAWVSSHRFELFKEYGEQMTYKHLYNAAKEAKIANRSKMNKAQLIAALNNVQPHVAVKPAPVRVPEKEAALRPKEAIMPAPVPLGLQLRKMVEENNPREICSFAVQYVGEFKPQFHYNSYCHAKLMYQNEGIETLVEDVARHVKKHANPEAYKEYLDYLINRSPHAPNFLTKSVDEAIEGGLYLNTNGLHSRVVASIVASREGSEFPQQVKLFKQFKDVGISENVSWFLANFLYPYDNRYSINQKGDGHSVLNYSMDYSDICKFFKEGFHRNLLESPMKVKTGAYQIFESVASTHKKKGISLYQTMLDTMNEKRNGGFGAMTKFYTMYELKPLIEKLEKDFT